MSFSSKASERGLPDTVSHSVAKNYLRGSIGLWQKITGGLIDNVVDTVREATLERLQHHFSRYQHGGLCQDIQ